MCSILISSISSMFYVLDKTVCDHPSQLIPFFCHILVFTIGSFFHSRVLIVAWLVDNPSICVPKGVQWGQGSIHLLCSFFCIFLWCFYVLYKTLCDHPSQPIPVTIESLFIIGSLAWCARLIALSASFWLCEIDVELFLGRFRSSPLRYVLGMLVYFDQVFSLRFFRAACLWTLEAMDGKNIYRYVKKDGKAT